MFWSKNKKKRSIIGVDIGTADIKLAEVRHADGNMVLGTYGIVNCPYQLGNKNNEHAMANMAALLKNLVQKAGIISRDCVISFPNSSVFTSVIEMPKMSEKELGSAVEFEAKKYVPLPITEIDLSWSIISETEENLEKQKILLTAVPRQISLDYQAMFEMAGLNLLAGEIEALALIRSLIGNAPLNCVIIDIGGKSTGLNIIENGLLRLSRSLNIGGDTMTAKIAESLNITKERAEQFKRDFGVSGNTFIPDAVKPVLNLIKNEVKQLLSIYQTHGIGAERVIIVGGGANLPGILDFFSDLNAKVELGDPLKTVSYSQSLSPILKRYAMNLPIAIGLAMREEE